MCNKNENSPYLVLRQEILRELDIRGRNGQKHLQEDLFISECHKIKSLATTWATKHLKNN